MNGDGPAALMHMLRSYDLTVWDPRPPATEALIESIASNLTGVSAWMHDSIETGRIAGADWQDWPDERVDTTFLRDAFDAWASKPANKYRGVNIDQRIFGKNLKPFLRGGEAGADRVVSGLMAIYCLIWRTPAMLWIKSL